MKIVVTIPIILVFLIGGYFTLRYGYVVFDRKVFDFQIDPILKSVEISSLLTLTGFSGCSGQRRCVKSWRPYMPWQATLIIRA